MEIQVFTIVDEGGPESSIFNLDWMRGSTDDWRLESVKRVVSTFYYRKPT